MKIFTLQHILAVAAMVAMGAWAPQAQAQETPASGAVDPAGATPAAAAPVTRPLPEEKNWRFGVALGYGQRTNPLIQSDDIPVLVDLDIAWFGERWFFDNFDLGFELVDRPSFTTNLVARVNSDRAFFSKTNTKYINFSYLGGGVIGPAVDPGSGSLVDEPVKFKPPKRDYAIEAGFEMLMDGEWGMAALRAFHDVSGTHHGYEVSADYGYRWVRGRWSIAPSVGVSYKSAALSDYYWGVHEDEATFLLPAYEAEGGVGWEAGLRTSYYLTRNVRLAVSANYESLQHSVAMSPLVEEDHVLGYFAGAAWQF
jgi:outer membrane protein